MINGRLYLAGGFDNNVPSATVESYDPSTNSWRKEAAMPYPVAAPGSAVINGKLYVAGGDTPQGVVNSALVYDPASSTWRQVSPMPGGARYYLAMTSIKGILYAVGGETPPSGVSGPVGTNAAYLP